MSDQDNPAIKENEEATGFNPIEDVLATSPNEEGPDDFTDEAALEALDEGLAEPETQEEGLEKSAREAMLAKAAEMRAEVAQDPFLVGKDADLLTYNRETGQFEPVSEEARHMLSSLGEAADIGMVRPGSGSKFAMPMTFFREGGLLTGSSDNRAPIKVADNLDDKDSLNIYSESMNGRLERLSEKAEQDDMATPATDRPPEQKSDTEEQGTEEEGSEKENEVDPFESTDKADNQNQQRQPPGDKTNGQMLADTTLSLLDSSLKFTGAAIDLSRRLLNGAAEMASGLYHAAGNILTTDIMDLRSGSNEAPAEKQNAQINRWLESSEGRSQLQAANEGPSLSDPITPDAETNATAAIGKAGIAERVRQFSANHEAPARQKAADIRSDYSKTLSENLNEIESSLKLNEVGQIPLTSSSDFENRLKTANPEDRDRATSALNNIAKAGQQYHNDTQRFLMGDGESREMDKLSLGNAKEEVEAFDKLAAKPDSDLEDHQKKLLDKLSVNGEPLGDQMANLFSSLRNMMQSVSSRITSLGGSENQAGITASNSAHVSQESTSSVGQG